MPESTARRSSRERYQFTWSISSEPPANPDVEEDAAGRPADEFFAAGDQPQEAAQTFNGPASTAEQDGEVGRAIPADEGSWKIFHTSPKSNGRFGPSAGGLSVSARLGAVAAWSCVAGTGAAILLINPGAILALRFAALGAVWAGISAALWIIPSKLK